jgi:hypothetical protein
MPRCLSTTYVDGEMIVGQECSSQQGMRWLKVGMPAAQLFFKARGEGTGPVLTLTNSLLRGRNTSKSSAGYEGSMPYRIQSATERTAPTTTHDPCCERATPLGAKRPGAV